MESGGVDSFNGSTDASTITFLMVVVPPIPVPLAVPFPFSARCDSCKARRSALFNLGFFGGMTRFLGASLFDLLGFASVTAAVVAPAVSVVMVDSGLFVTSG